MKVAMVACAPEQPKLMAAVKQGVAELREFALHA